MVYKIVTRHTQEVEWFVDAETEDAAVRAALLWALDDCDNVRDCVVATVCYRDPKDSEVIEAPRVSSYEEARKTWSERMPKWLPDKPWQVVSTAKSSTGEKFYLSWDASRPADHDIKEVTLRELRAREDGAEPFVGRLFKIVTPLPATHYYRLRRREGDLVLD